MIKLDKRNLIMAIKNRLKELRKNKRLTLDDIYEDTNIKRATFSNYENGKTEPKLETWQKLANYFNVSVPYLQGVSDEYELPNHNAETSTTFDLLDDGLHVTIGGKDIPTEDIEKIREYALFITKSD